MAPYNGRGGAAEFLGAEGGQGVLNGHYATSTNEVTELGKKRFAYLRALESDTKVAWAWPFAIRVHSGAGAPEFSGLLGILCLISKAILLSFARLDVSGPLLFSAKIGATVRLFSAYNCVRCKNDLTNYTPIVNKFGNCVKHYFH